MLNQERNLQRNDVPNDLNRIKNEVNRNPYSQNPLTENNFQRRIPEGLMNAPSPTPVSISSPNIDGSQNEYNSNAQIQPYSTRPQFQIGAASVDSFSPEPPSRASFEMVEEIVESVVKEKWDDMIKSMGDFKTWKERMQIDASATKQEILRLGERFENLQKSVMVRLSDYDSGVREVGTDMKALEQVLQKILGPLTRNIKELEKIVEDLKKRKK